MSPFRDNTYLINSILKHHFGYFLRNMGTHLAINLHLGKVGNAVGWTDGWTDGQTERQVDLYESLGSSM